MVSERERIAPSSGFRCREQSPTDLAGEGGVIACRNSTIRTQQLGDEKLLQNDSCARSGLFFLRISTY